MRTLQLLAVTAALAASVLAPRSAAQASYSVLYRFNGGLQEPEGVVAGPNGVLYGVSSGASGPPYGAVFQLQQGPLGHWNGTTLYGFTGQNGDGANGLSHAVPVVDPHGNIFGTTTGGGAYGFGTVFELTPPAIAGGTWTETILYSFTPGYGASNVVLGANGVLYGINSSGGVFDQGMVFQLTPPASSGAWTSKVLYSFTGGADGANPVGLTFGPNGILYGAASEGGSVGEGAVFQLTPPAKFPGVWTETVLYNFLGGEAGANPSGPLIVNGNGSLYGTTPSSVFLLTPPAPGAAPGTAWTQTVVHSFWGDPLGGPDSPLIVHNGVIYGARSALFCICTCSGGAVYQLTPGAGGGPWTETVLHRLGGSEEPFGTLVIDQSGTLFGTTLGGPGFVGSGIFYKIDPSGTALENSNDDPPPCGVCCDMRNAVTGRQH